MTVALPWAGGDVNGLVAMSGRAAVPFTPAGTGFNWSSLVGRVSGYVRPVRGYSLRGLGQDSVDLVLPGTDLTPISTPPILPVDLSSLGPSTLAPQSPTLASIAAGGASNASAQAPWWGNILQTALTKGLTVGSQIASYQLNPLYQKQTFYQTPQGAVYASNVGAGAVVPGLTTATTSSLLPILLIGGGLLVFMMMSRNR